MRKYLARLHKKPDHHKKQFAFLVSATVTLFIFGVWSITTFGVHQEVIAEEKVEEVGPFQSLRANVFSGLQAFGDSFDKMKSGFKSIDFEAEYKDIREGALDIYGR